MDRELLALAFTAGLVAALNPCGFAMLPGYLVLVVRGDDQSRPAAIGRALGATAAMAVGFVAVFGLFGLLTVAAASTLQQYLPYATIVIGLGLVALGAWLLSGRELHVPGVPRLGGAPSTRLASMFGYGVAYATASLSCTVGPFLAVTGASLRTATVPGVVAVYAAYVGGLALVVGALAVAAVLTTAGLADALRRALPWVNRASGVLLIAAGLYVGYYGLYEVRLFQLDGSPRDPVVAAAGRVQGLLAGWVHAHGAWPWLILLALVGVVGGVAAVRRR